MFTSVNHHFMHIPDCALASVMQAFMVVKCLTQAVTSVLKQSMCVLPIWFMFICFAAPEVDITVMAP